MASSKDNYAAENDDQTYDEQLATCGKQQNTQSIATCELHEPAKSNERNESQIDSDDQLDCTAMVAAIMDRLQEEDMEEIDASIAKSPLKASTSVIVDSEPVAEMPQVFDEKHDEVRMVLPAIQSVQSGLSAEQRVMENTPSLDSSSSSECLETTAPRARRCTRRKVSFTERLEPFENITSMTKPRRNFDIFNLSCRTVWNNTIQDLQSRLAEWFTRQQLDEGAPILCEVLSDQNIDSGFLQTAMDVTEGSNFEANIEADDVEATNKHDPINTSDPMATMLKDSGVQMESIAGKLVDVPDRVEACAEVTLEFQESAKNSVIPVITTPETPKNSRNRHKKTVMVRNRNGPIQAISEQCRNSQEMASLDVMIIHILIAVQGELCNRKRTENWTSVKRLQEVLHINTRLGTSKLFKNLILLKQANLLTVKLNAEHQITDVCVKLPQVDKGQ
ncbi:uncharacterized protein LOC126560395 [Anopheles maculipalpis]|uniref:uncharacterized protein LOC126560395 n=1 Tax=Anopheles maculipalpis TaxID=1496333 RepID=UPI002158C0E2|nr:uncharacterized protein LOC126560395 [Anopheles maculipalpis]